jgi:hypothetical protein
MNPSSAPIRFGIKPDPNDAFVNGKTVVLSDKKYYPMTRLRLQRRKRSKKTLTTASSKKNILDEGKDKDTESWTPLSLSHGDVNGNSVKELEVDVEVEVEGGRQESEKVQEGKTTTNAYRTFVLQHYVCA